MQEKTESELESARLLLLQFDHQIASLSHQKSTKTAELEKLAHFRVKIGDEIEKGRSEILLLEKGMKEMVKRNEWIEDNQK